MFGGWLLELEQLYHGRGGPLGAASVSRLRVLGSATSGHLAWTVDG